MPKVLDVTEVFDPMFLETEDGGAALIYTVSEDVEAEAGMFARVQSWDETGEHSDMKRLIGRKVRVTVEILD